MRFIHCDNTRMLMVYTSHCLLSQLVIFSKMITWGIFVVIVSKELYAKNFFYVYAANIQNLYVFNDRQNKNIYSLLS